MTIANIPAAGAATAGAYLGEITWREAEAQLPARLVIIPFAAGAKEHGEHLPLGTDQIVMRALLDAAVAERDVLVAPPILHGWFHLLLSHAFFFRKLFLEDRIFHRLPLEISVTVTVKNQKYVGVTVDISKGGIGIALPLKIPHRERLDLELEFSQKHYHFKGKIVMKKRWEGKRFFYGIAFINLTQDELKSMNKIIASLER